MGLLPRLGGWVLAEACRQAAEWQRETPGFELNDVGYLTAADERSAVATLGWEQPRPSARVQSYGASVYDAEAWTWDGTRTGRTVGLTAFGYAQAGWGGTATLERGFRGLSRTAARGGPLVVAGASTTASYSVLTDPRRVLGLVAYGRHAAGEFGDRSTELGASITLRPGPSVQLAFGPSVTKSHDVAAYVADVPDTLAAATYGRRYVFGALDQRSIGLAARAEVAFAPDLSLQLYAQPYAAAARYARRRPPPISAAASTPTPAAIAAAASGRSVTTRPMPDARPTARRAASTAVIPFVPTASRASAVRAFTVSNARCAAPSAVSSLTPSDWSVVSTQS